MFKKLVFAAIAKSQAIDGRIVSISNGQVVGTRVEVGASEYVKSQAVDVFRGIPFAEPPIGNRRFRPPTPYLRTWTEPYQAKRKQVVCASQLGGVEDCLYLNVFAPAAARPIGSLLPVMVYIHGGGFTFGDAREGDGESLADLHDVVVVAGNYRLGAFGFFSSQSTLEESGTTGNWGILDQQMILRWVQTNIDAFGGDKNRVMLFGHSAGGISVAAHLVSQGSAGLFHSAAMMAGSTHLNTFFQPKEEAFKFSEWIATQVAGCSSPADLECLRSVPESQLTLNWGLRDNEFGPPAASCFYPDMPFGLTIDGSVLKGTPHELAARGEIANPVPLITGVTQDEGAKYFHDMRRKVRPAMKRPYDQGEIRRALEYFYKSDSGELVDDRDIQIFEQSFFADKPSIISDEDGNPVLTMGAFKYFADFMRNAFFACPSLSLSELWASAGHPVYLYNFDYEKLTPDEAAQEAPYHIRIQDAKITYSDFGKVHGAEVQFVLNRVYPDSTYNPSVVHVSRFMSCLWTNMAKCSSPSCAPCAGNTSGVEWKRYTSEQKEFFSFNPDGSASVQRVRATGPSHLPTDRQIAAFPTAEKCDWYMGLHVNFQSFRSESSSSRIRLPRNQPSRVMSPPIQDDRFGNGLPKQQIRNDSPVQNHLHPAQHPEPNRVHASSLGSSLSLVHMIALALTASLLI